jgi:hypothetical protein
MINNFYIEYFYAFSSDVAGACTYGSDDSKIVVLLRNIKETLGRMKHSEDGFAEYFTITQENCSKNPDPYIFSSRKIEYFSRKCPISRPHSSSTEE